ncbi:MAG: hypothetical protein ABI806_10700 [Candidatus Solibacter sp.]
MTARVCQLCGKALSRLRVGGDGDYCSKEHRNQHRLRQGMDRLEEASKVTSLMRRRENPRHISTAQLMRNSAQERRGYLDAKSQVLRADISVFAPVLPGPEAPRVRARADQYVTPHATRMQGAELARRADGQKIRITGATNVPAVQQRKQRMGAKIAQAPMVTLHCDAPGVRITARDFGMLRGQAVRVYLGKAALTPEGAGSRRTLIGKVETRRVPSKAVLGNALRVSIGIGFRLGKVNWRSIKPQPPDAPALVWPGKTLRIPSASHDELALPRDLELGIRMAPVWLPAVAAQTRRAQFIYPGSVEHRRRQPAKGTSPSKRHTDIEWRVTEPRSRGMAVEPPPAGFSRRNGAHLFTLVLLPTTREGARQELFKAFVPQEPGGLPKVSFEGTVAAAIVGTPGAGGNVDLPEAPAAPEPAETVRIEEHFGQGWDAWVGGTSEWKVDVAGVRTGPLALYKPSLELIDYDVEFLARIDTRSLNWVVRAAGLEEYVLCTLTAIPGGELEFTRCAVIDNKPQGVVTATKRVPGKPRTAMTVGTRVNGDTFAVSVDGADIDFWNDDRFPMGGTGFLGAPDDRARLYWVRLSSTELTAKEYQKK